MGGLIALLQQRPLLLDGGMGTMIQSFGIHEGCNELLCLSRPEVIEKIHRRYLEAGCDIIETNTFSANALSLGEYKLADKVRELNLAACRLARKAVEECGHPAFVAGSLGPTSSSLCLATDANDPAFREYGFQDFYNLHFQQACALIEGGVDLLLVETVFDTLVAKSAVLACLDAATQAGRIVPVSVSATFSDASQRLLSGQTIEAFASTMLALPIFSLGLNCSTGPRDMLGLIRHLDEICPIPTSAHPNAGFPDEDGIYRLIPSQFAAQLEPVLEEGRLNIVGGCCGTTPDHIAALKTQLASAKLRNPKQSSHALTLAGLEHVEVEPGKLVMIGERTNVAGSRKFARLIKEKKWEEALKIARKQVLDGAMVLDICMDDSMLDAGFSLRTFLRYAASDQVVSSAAWMIDSSDWSVIEDALTELPGRGIVNSISLKEGEQLFVERARTIQRHAHAMVVMLFDEKGQATTYERRLEVAERSYRLLVESGIREEDIIFDANVLAIATGIEEHDTYARDFILATKELKRRYPLCHTSGGISNLSFSFRGNDRLRGAMHAVFLQLAALDMAIVNPGSMVEIANLDPKTVQIIGKALMAEEGGMADLITLAMQMQEDVKPQQNVQQVSMDPKQRLFEAVVQGDHTWLEKDLAALETENPLELVDGPLMDGMREVGRLFGEGKLFLPQVVRSARTMSLAVQLLQPRIVEALGKQKGREEIQRKPVVVMATVKGDVHDIGKNIVSLILTCNGFEVIDLGVMVPAEDILKAALANRADMVGISGLITPSLKEMQHVISMFAKAGIDTPLFVGGATTSELHTAVKFAPLTTGSVVWTKDASSMALAAKQVMGKNRTAFLQQVSEAYRKLREEHRRRESQSTGGYEQALLKQQQKERGSSAQTYGVFVETHAPTSGIVEFINWKMYCNTWGVPADSKEGGNLIEEAKVLLDAGVFDCKAVYGLFPASSDRLEVKVSDSAFFFLRDEESGYCLADSIAKEDTVGLFVASVFIKDDSSLAVKLLADRLAEAMAEYVQRTLAGLWKAGLESFIRPAPGYPSWSDHSEKKTIFKLLDVHRQLGVRLTETYAMDPPSSVCGMLIGGEDLRYFAVKQVSRQQLEFYARHKKMSVDELATLLAGMEY